MDDLDKLARTLTEAQRRALPKLGKFVGCRHPLFRFVGDYNGIKARTLNALFARQLVWGRENYQSRFVGLTPLGLALKAHIERNEG